MTVEQDFETVGEVLDRTGYDDKARAALSRIEAEVERLRADQWFYSDMKAAWAERDAFKVEVERLRAELQRGCERDPLHQCPNCREALEKAR